MENVLLIYKEYINDKVNTIHYLLPMNQLYLLEIDHHEGLGPLHFYDVATPKDEDIPEELRDSVDEEKYKAYKIVRNYNKFIKNKIKIIFSDTDSFFYTKNNIGNDHVVKKIIYIHKKN